MASFDINQAPNPTGVGKPGSGTYGEGAALDRLKASFPTAPPTAGPGGATGPAPMPTPGVGPAPAGPPPGVPAGIMKPTMRPDVPVGTPLQTGPPPNPVLQAQSARQRNLAVLDGMVNNPNTSEATKEWARDLINNLINGSKR